jgi:hypothetical protein
MSNHIRHPDVIVPAETVKACISQAGYDFLRSIVPFLGAGGRVYAVFFILPISVLNSQVVLKEYSGNAESMMEDYSKLMATSADMVVRHYNKGRYDQQAKRAREAMDKLILDLNPKGSFHHSLAFLA